MTNERRPGDWLRKDMRQDANEVIRDDDGKKWYDQTFWIAALLLVLWPVGLGLCRRSDWPLVAKIMATALVAICVYMVWGMQQAVITLGL